MKFLHLVCLSIIAGVALATISGWLFWQDRESSTATGGEVAKSFGQPEFHGTISLKNRESTPLSEFEEDLTRGRSCLGSARASEGEFTAQLPPRLSRLRDLCSGACEEPSPSSPCPVVRSQVASSSSGRPLLEAPLFCHSSSVPTVEYSSTTTSSATHS